MPAWWLTACLAVALREVFALYLLCNTEGITGRRSGDFFFFFTKTTSTILQGIKSLTPTDPGALRTANIPLPSTIYLSNVAFNIYGRFLLYKVAFISYHNTYTFALLSESGAWKSI